MQKIMMKFLSNLFRKDILRRTARKIKKDDKLTYSDVLYLVTTGIIDEGDLEDVLSYVAEEREYVEKYERRFGKDYLNDGCRNEIKKVRAEQKKDYLNY